MTDKELLELAAKAAGLTWENVILDGGGFVHNGRQWDPLTDDGDALRLAVKLKFWVQVNHMNIEVELWQDESGETKAITEPTDPLCDYAWATRRAIVRAAAEIGKSI